jgi:hypothetical protein
MIMRTTKRIIAGHYEVTTEHGVFKIDHECGLWSVVAPTGFVNHAKTYAGARRMINIICTDLSN